MVLSKVYSVHLLVHLGYDVLLQDVDVVWMRDPMELFNALRFSQYDMIFQDDGSRTAEFAPHFANTGCYFVRNNDRTKYFYSHLIRMGDVIRALRCDQMTISVALNDIVSWKGLKVKVLGRDTVDGRALPGGFHFHRRLDFMRTLLRGEVQPYLFHMSWTLNKVTKRRFLSQVGEWYVNSTCGGEAQDNFRFPAAATDVLGACCAAQPIVRCHYSDAPSIVDCRDSDPLVKGREPFWKNELPPRPKT
jgi:Nucleotide-diphospho-sugar transferase